ncbi:MAG: SpoIIE family protein phosphatase [Candidatus Eremiobacteraeota bacterium]|nr:SpoIIE family protein phosphatase [Candidatus Eremiobacteraeota bacterium]
MNTRPDAALDPWDLCDGLPGIVCVAGARGEIIYANRDWRDAFGTSESPESVPARDAWLEVSRTGVAYERQERFLDRTGTFRWYQVRARPLRSKTGPTLYVVVLSDIDEEKRYARYIEILGEATEIFGSVPDIDTALERIAGSIVPLAADWFVLHRPGNDGEFVAKYVVHADPARRRLLARTIDLKGSISRKLVERAVTTGEPAVLREITPELQRQLAADSTHLETIRQLNARSIVVVPIVGRDETWGTLQFRNDWTTARLFGEADVQLARELAKRVAAAFDNAVLVESAERAASDLRFLAEVGETMVESLDLASRLDRFVNAVVPRLADWATVNLLLDDASVETVAIAHRDAGKRAIVERLRGPYYGALDTEAGTPIVLRTGRPRLLTGVDERFLRKHLRPETFADVIALGADSSFVVPLAANGEIYGTLAAMRAENERPFSEGDMWLIEELARRAAAGIANARLFERNANVANAFQVASLPRSLPAVPGASFSAFYAPGRSEAMIGGDWYDAFPLGDGRLVVSIGDVSGSGLSAAVIMGSVRQLIRGAVQLQPNARVILDATDRAIRTEFPDCLVTAFVAILDLEAGTIAYASAGHPPPILCSQGPLVFLDEVGLPLGLRSDAEPPERVVRFAHGDMLVLYTDGLTESTRDVIDGERSVRTALESGAIRRADSPARALHDAVVLGGAADDVAILAVTLGRKA